MTDDPPGHASARTGIDGQDAVRPLLHDDLPPDPPPAFAGVVVVAQGQGRPGHLSQFFPVMGAAALVHGLITGQTMKMVKEHRQPPSFRVIKSFTP